MRFYRPSFVFFSLILPFGLLQPLAIGADSAMEASKILTESGVTGGFIVHLGVGNGELTSSLRSSDSIQVQGLDRDPIRVKAAREKIRNSGNYGNVAIERLEGKQLPYVDNLVNLMVIDDLGDLDWEEVMRVLVPNGVAYLKSSDGTWKKTVKPRPKNIDEWSHYLHDATGNSVAHDEVVAPPRHLQWVGSPRYSRHHDRMASMSALVSTGGKMFYIMDEGSRISIQLPSKWKLIARDAFNGTILWKRDIDTWQSHLWPLKSGPSQLSRRLVSDDKTVYAPLGYDAPLSAIDANTGKTIRVYEGTDATEEIVNTQGRLFLVVRKGDAELANYAPVNGRVGDQALAREMFWNEEPRLLMAFEASTGKQLWAKQAKVSPLTLAADSENAYFHDGEKLICLDQKTGAMLWQSESVSRRNQFTFNFGPRLVIHDDVVLYAGGDGRMLSISKQDGKTLWKAEHPNSGYQSPQDLLVVDGLVWCAPTTSGKDSGVYTGRDPKTGEVKKSFAPDVQTYWFHHRCYIAKATDKFLMPSRTGIEFVSPEKEHWDIHHWVRGGCLYGIMPCNGLTYAPPHNCACYPEAKLFGFNALAPLAPTRPIPTEVSEEGRLEKGPSYDIALEDASSQPKGDWPTFRHDPARSGAASTAIDAKVQKKWSIPLGGRLTSPVIANGKVFVAKMDEHTLYAFDETEGKQLWAHTIGARIDSPPTIYKGKVVFGGADGWIYCLQSSDGSLAWRYRGAPLDRRTMAYEQLESLWPVHGSVLIQNDVVHSVAGRSAFLDGGLRLIRQDLSTGKKLSESLMDSTNPETGGDLQELVKVLQMPVGLTDILSSDGKYIFMKSQKFDLEGKRLDLGPNSGDFVGQASVQRGEGAHLFAPMGFLDDSWFHRSYWVLGKSFAGGHGGYYQAGRFAPSGRLLVQGNGYVYGYGRKPEYLRWTTTMEHQLFKAEPNAPELPEDFQKVGGGASSGAMPEVFAQFPKSPSLNPLGQPITLEAWITTTKPNGVVAARGGPAEGFALSIAEGHAVFSIRSGGDLSSVKSPNRVIGGWHHLVGVLTPDKKMQLYVDGERVAEGKSTGLLTKDPAQGLEIGADLAGAVGEYESPNSFTGIIDEVRLYFAETSDEAVAERFKNGSELGRDPRLVLTFDDGTARDFSTYRNNGTMEGGILVEGHIGKAMRFTSQGVKKAGAEANNSKKKATRAAATESNASAPAPPAANQTTSSQAQGNSFVKPKWTSDVPIYVRAMVLSGNKLFIAGPLDIIDEEKTFKQLSERDPEVQSLLAKQDDAMEGKFSGKLLTVDCDSSTVESEIDLGTLPAWDGMAGANGSLFLSTTDGQLICFGK
ncbi:MAG: PQQ-binding-like beta-propeller repeat protein [Planctomycetota bacterium]|nr:PQQ-binding-like beta-propeller repeat protein [Planctomycetota bacterium]